MPPYHKKRNNNNHTNKATTPCKYFQQGRCNNSRCPFLHVRGGGANPEKNNNDRQNNASGSLTADVLSTMLKLFFEKNQSTIYNSEEGRLNLSRLATYPDLQAVSSSINFNTRTFCEALCRCVRELIVPPPTILSLDENSIFSFYHMARTLEEADLHTSVRALSLARNQIKGTEIAAELKGFQQLLELYLPKNPVTEAADYRQKVKKYLPSLLCLDGNPIYAPPLALPWPLFMGEEGSRVGEPPRQYDEVQKNILQFIQCSILNPLELSPEPGRITGVDAVSDVYDVNATLTLSLSSQEGAVATPQRTAGGNKTSAQRNAIREIVGFRLRQTESDHNVLRGIKSTQVAIGRTKVCAQLEHWLYPKNFSVGHYLHSGPDVAVLDNLGFGPSAVVGMKVPLSIITMHGVMIWWHRPPGTTPSIQDAVVIKRNFSRVFTVSNSEPGRWRVVNDMVSLYPFIGTETEGAAKELTMDNVLFKDIHPYDVVFSPALDPNRAGRFARKYNVPESVVKTLARYMTNDLEFISVLTDLSGVPLDIFEQCAGMVSMDPLAAAWLCRLGNRYGIEPQAGVAILQKCGLVWADIMAAVTAQQQGST